MKPKLILGLSGGVDSAVSAALLRESYDVHCVFLDIGLGGGGDAEALADRLGLPFHSVDIRAELEHFVCADFAREYLAGRTPLPCARCNPLVKFPALGRVGEQVGAEFIARGPHSSAQGPARQRPVLHALPPDPGPAAAYCLPPGRL